MGHVVKIVTKTFFDAGVASPTENLSIAGQAAPDGVTKIIAGKLPAKLPHKLRTLGSRADKTHIPAQNIPQLRKFIEAGAPEQCADPRTSGIVRHRPHGAEVPFG